MKKSTRFDCQFSEKCVINFKSVIQSRLSSVGKSGVKDKSVFLGVRFITNMSSLLSGKGLCCRDATLDSKLLDCIIFFAASDTFSICRPWTGLKRDGYASLCLSVQAVTGSRLTVGLVLHLSHRFKSPRSTELEIECQRPHIIIVHTRSLSLRFLAASRR